MHLDWNKYQEITKIVVLPLYPNLRNLNLGGNNIVSLEVMSQLQAPLLE